MEDYTKKGGKYIAEKKEVNSRKNKVQQGLASDERFCWFQHTESIGKIM